MGTRSRTGVRPRVNYAVLSGLKPRKQQVANSLMQVEAPPEKAQQLQACVDTFMSTDTPDQGLTGLEGLLSGLSFAQPTSTDIDALCAKLQSASMGGRKRRTRKGKKGKKSKKTRKH